MTPYHGTPVGGKTEERARFLCGRHALVSYAHPEDMALVADQCKSFVLDNGAFTSWRRGEAVDWDGYYKWVRAWYRHPGFDFALIPDVIDGSEVENDRLLSVWPSEVRGVPVWHLHESVDRLLHLAQRYDTVALGSSGQWSHPGSKVWWDRMTVVMDSICDSNGVPPCRLHGLRMLNPKVFTRLPLASADSVNASVNAGSLARFGMYVPVSRSQRAGIIADRTEVFNSAPVWRKGFKPEVGHDYDDL